MNPTTSSTGPHVTHRAVVSAGIARRNARNPRTAPRPRPAAPARADEPRPSAATATSAIAGASPSSVRPAVPAPRAAAPTSAAPPMGRPACAVATQSVGAAAKIASARVAVAPAPCPSIARGPERTASAAPNAAAPPSPRTTNPVDTSERSRRCPTTPLSSGLSASNRISIPTEYRAHAVAP